MIIEPKKYYLFTYIAEYAYSSSIKTYTKVFEFDTSLNPVQCFNKAKKELDDLGESQKCYYNIINMVKIDN